MTAEEFIRTAVKFSKEMKLKIRTKPEGNWENIDLKDKMPSKIYGFAIYGKVDG